MPCPTCGGNDHQRSSSNKCPKRKRRLREEHLAEDEENSIYCVKKGLTSFVCPLLQPTIKEKLLYAIRDDVRTLSRLNIELSYLVNYFFKHYYDHEDFHVMFPKFDALQFTYALKKKQEFKLQDPMNIINKYKELNGNISYDGCLRSFNLYALANQYQTVLETNIQTHAFQRIKRYLAHKHSQYTKSHVHEICFNAFYKSETAGDENELGAWFRTNDVSERNLNKNYWKYVPLFVRMQHELAKDNIKSFNVFPIFSHGLKFLAYDSSCLHQLLRRIDAENTPTVWSIFRKDYKRYWNRLFDVPKHFGNSFSTDGISVSLSMNRTVKKGKKYKAKRIKRDEAQLLNESKSKGKYSKIVAVDPGAKTPIVTCTRTATGEFEYKMLKKGTVVYDSKEYGREKKRNKYVKGVDTEIKRDMEALNRTLNFELSRKNAHVHEYTRFQLKWFDKKQSLYEQRRVQRLKFDKYINDQKVTKKIVDEYFGKETDTLVVYGSGFDFMNRGSFKGHRKFRHNAVIREIKQRNNLSLYIINEAFTTKNCSKCYESGDKVHNRLLVSESPHRYVYCSICRKGIHRDKNGAKNILLKYEYKMDLLPSILSCAGNDMNCLQGSLS